jgi:hypothetical protein
VDATMMNLENTFANVATISQNLQIENAKTKFNYQLFVIVPFSEPMKLPLIAHAMCLTKNTLTISQF